MPLFSARRHHPGTGNQGVATGAGQRAASRRADLWLPGDRFAGLTGGDGHNPYVTSGVPITWFKCSRTVEMMLIYTCLVIATLNFDRCLMIWTGYANKLPLSGRAATVTFGDSTVSSVNLEASARSELFDLAAAAGSGPWFQAVLRRLPVNCCQDLEREWSAAVVVKEAPGAVVNAVLKKNFIGTSYSGTNGITGISDTSRYGHKPHTGTDRQESYGDSLHLCPLALFWVAFQHLMRRLNAACMSLTPGPRRPGGIRAGCWLVAATVTWHDHPVPNSLTSCAVRDLYRRCQDRWPVPAGC